MELKNSAISLQVSAKGAEIQSIIKNGVEFLWQADPDFWPRKAPVLFPIVGRVIDNNYQVGGNSYTLSQHGFARDKEFELVSQTKESLLFALNSNEDSKKVYPFDFKLEIEYRLINNTVQIIQRVKNTGNGNMHYSLGNHPGFKCPLFENEQYEDYYLEFEYAEELKTFTLHNGYLSDKLEQVLDGSNVIELNYDVFKDDALIFDLSNCKSRFITLRNKKNKHSVKVTFEDFTWLGIWSKPGPFVCIEPWDGVTDRFDHNGDFTKKTAIQVLKSGEGKVYTWEIVIE